MAGKLKQGKLEMKRALNYLAITACYFLIAYCGAAFGAAFMAWAIR